MIDSSIRVSQNASVWCAQGEKWGARAKLDPAVRAPVEYSFWAEHNSPQPTKWAWG